MVTPFTRGGEYVDFDKVGPLAEMLQKQGAGGLFPCGTTGEGLLLSAEERKEVVAEVVAAVGKKLQVIAHTGAIDTATTIELTAQAADAGAHAAAIVAPFYYGYDAASLKNYYASIAKAVPGFPILLYNIPGCAKNVLDVELVVALAEKHDNIVGIKDSSGDMVHLSRLIAATPKGFNVINGVDEYGYQAFLAGTTAAVSGTSNVVLDIYRKLFDQVQHGNLKQAWKLQEKLLDACRYLEYGRKAAVFKEAMRLRGFDPGFVRPPQCELTAAEKKKLKAAMKTAGLI